MNPIFIDNSNKENNNTQNKNNCFLNCFKKKDSKIFPFFEYNDNIIYIRIYHYNSNKFFKYYTNSMYNKIIDIDIKDVKSFEIDKNDGISAFIKDSITKILGSNYVPKVINTISNDLILLILEEIYEKYKVNKELSTIIE
jgi:L-cysteine desulfidase